MAMQGAQPAHPIQGSGGLGALPHHPGDGLAAPGDHHLLARFDRIEQGRELGFGCRQSDRTHGDLVS